MGISDPTPEPLGTGDLWHTPGLRLPPAVQHVAAAIMARGVPRGRAIGIAKGVLARWARGGPHVKPSTQRAAIRAIAQWDAARALAHATPNKGDRRRAGESPN